MKSHKKKTSRKASTGKKKIHIDQSLEQFMPGVSRMGGLAPSHWECGIVPGAFGSSNRQEDLSD